MSRNLYTHALKYLATDSLFYLGTKYLSNDPPLLDSAMICYITAQNRLEKERGNKKMTEAIVKYDLQGRCVSNPDKGIYLKAEKLSNGDTRISKFLAR